jgi:hypothetical protein
MTYRNLKDDVKTEGFSCLRISSEDTCLPTGWHPVLRRRELDSGFRVERGNLSFRWQGRNSSGGPTRMRVPMRSTGADHPVVVRKFL